MFNSVRSITKAQLSLVAPGRVEGEGISPSIGPIHWPFYTTLKKTSFTVYDLGKGVFPVPSMHLCESTYVLQKAQSSWAAVETSHLDYWNSPNHDNVFSLYCN